MSEETVVYITSSILVFSMGLFIFLERKFPYRKGLPFLREGIWTDFFWYSIVQNFILKILIFDYIIHPIDLHWHLSRHLVSDWPILGQVLFFLVVHDFYIYWFHRWQHNSKILWRTHEAHHSATAIDWVAGSRSHALEIIINQTVEFLPIILLGADPIVIPIKACIDGVWGMYIHSNINVRSGKLQYFINGPEMHQWHHADQQEVFFSNYATKFAIWDWIFGTGYHPDFKPAKYGLPYAYPKDYFLQFIALFKKVDEEQWMKRRFFSSYKRIGPSLLRMTGLGKTLPKETVPSPVQETPVARDTKKSVSV
jgi:sterol desaturase/sphingolipid hydroxylase (fatty acid hydroxylase superfamily)